MRATWVTRSFLDYRVPVFRELDKLIGGGLTLLYFGEIVPDRVSNKVRSVLGDRAIPLTGEKRLIGRKKMGEGFANSGLRIPIQPGLVKEALHSEPDVVISDGFFQWTYAALWLRATRSIPHVMCYERTAHVERNSQWYRTTYRKTVMRWIDAMCCSGRLCGEYTQSLGFPGQRITYGHMVADVENMYQAASAVSEAQIAAVRARFQKREFTFLYVGRLIPLKGMVNLLEAWRGLFSGMVSATATLLVLGDGPQRGDLERYCAAYNLDNVRFVGAVDYDALAPYYKAADAFVIPTLEDNWSLVVPEAMTCGLPILCSKYNGCWPEYVTSTNGWVFDPLNLDDTVGCLRRCMEAKARLPEMGGESYRVIGNHTATHAAQAILMACEIALGRWKKK